MSIKTSRERRRDRIIGFIITVLILGCIAFGVEKLIGWDKLFSHRIGDAGSVDSAAIKDSAIHDTIHIADAYSDSIQLEYKDGHHYVTISIDGVKIKGLMDSGCTDGFTGSSIDYAFLIRHGYIKDNGPGQATIANGDTIDVRSCTAYKVKVGNVVFDSISCSFNDNENSPVLIGQNILKQLGVYIINYHNNKLYIK